MATTAAVVEILAAGLLALLWAVILPAMALFPDLQSSSNRLLQSFSPYSTLVVLIGLSIAYPLGWLVNAITYELAKLTYRKELLAEVLGRNCTDQMLSELKAVFTTSKDFDHLVSSLAHDTAVHRLARAAGLNSGILGLIMLWIGREDPNRLVASAIMLLLSASWWWVALVRHRRYYEKMRSGALRSEAALAVLKRMGEPRPTFELRSVRSILTALGRGGDRKPRAGHKEKKKPDRSG